MNWSFIGFWFITQTDWLGYNTHIISRGKEGCGEPVSNILLDSNLIWQWTNSVYYIFGYKIALTKIYMCYRCIRTCVFAFVAVTIK